jgi:ATF/CREB family transcription factor
MEPEPPSEDEQDMSKEEYNHPNGKKMTDEEKRKNFLERNR